MILESDAFRIEYDPSCIDAEQIVARVRGLGYKPQAIEGANRNNAPSGRHRKPFPEPVATAARESSKFLLLVFYTKWCGPCKALENTVLNSSEIEKALERFEFVKVDTDHFPRAAEYFGIVALPSLVVLDGHGNELFRNVGPIGASALAHALRRCIDDEQPAERRD